MIVDRFPDRAITINGKEHLYFGGTSYLGMAVLPEFQDLVVKNLKKWGTFYGSSRNANVKLGVYRKAEQLFSEHINSEAALTISSGTLAGKLVTAYLSKTTRKFFHYPKTHPAIIVEKSLPLFVDGRLHPTLLDNVSEELVITTDAILSLEVSPTSFDFLDQISPQKRITLVIDESHSLGIVGEHGKGIFNTIQHQTLDRKIMISSLGKALGLPGGVIASDSGFIKVLQKEPTFVAASGAGPAFLATYIEAKNLYKKQLEKLRTNLDFMKRELKPVSNIIFNANYPVIYSNNDTIFATLLENNIVITSFNYPTYKNPMNRMVITATHTREDIQSLIQIINTNG